MKPNFDYACHDGNYAMGELLIVGRRPKQADVQSV